MWLVSTWPFLTESVNVSSEVCMRASRERRSEDDMARKGAKSMLIRSYSSGRWTLFTLDRRASRRSLSAIRSSR